MEYLEFKPHKSLVPWIECLWTLEEGVSREPARPHLLVPDGRPELIVHFKHPFVRRQAGMDVVREAVLSGQLLEPIGLITTGDVGLVAARFRPEGLSLFGSLPAFELAGEAMHVADFRRDGGTLHEQIATCSSREARLGVLERFLLACAPEANCHPSRVAAAVNLIRYHRGQLTIDSVCSAVECQRRHLERLFRERVGVSPKLFSRIVRFQALLRRLTNASPPRWSDLAVDCGYYDQAHMLRDFAKLAGCSGGAYVAARHGLAARIAKN